MRTLHSIEELTDVPGPIFLAIGVFDGMHLGHRAVIQRALSGAKQKGGTVVAVTFDPHPARVLRPEKAPRLLTATQHKLELIAALGVEHMLVIPFTREFADMEAEQFIFQLHACCKPLREICVGYEWCFGKNRAGNLELLRRLGHELGFEEVGVPAVRADGEIVSSTLIRAAIEAGELTRAAQLLGRDYSVLGTVVKGDGIGRQLGFPTANLSTHNEQFPPNGVYAVEARIGERKLPGVVNIGVRPTISHASGERLLELHLLGFHEEIYGTDIEVFFRRFLRAEKKFDSLETLRTQITADAAQARDFLKRSEFLETSS
jgi:riboflavin kinase/FMN adenylyltransferase